MPILVDYSQTCLSSILSQPTHVIDGIEENSSQESLLRHIILNGIRSYRSKFGNEYGELIICCDSPNSWRKEVFPLYKANRKKNQNEDAKAYWDKIFMVLNQTREDLANFFPYPVVRAERAEGDDVISVLTKYFISIHQKVLIISGDHDFIQLQKLNQLSASVTQYDPVQKKYVKDDLSPEDYLKVHVLRGDSGDGIPNILSDDDVFVSDNKRSVPITKSRLKSYLVACESNKLSDFCNTEILMKRYERNRKIIDLIDGIPYEISDSIINNYNSEVNRVRVTGRKHLFNYFMKTGSKAMFERIADF